MHKPKLILYTLLILFAGCFLSDAHAQNFEGVIHYETPAVQNGAMGDLAYMIKGDKVRMEMGQGQNKAAIIFEPEKSESIIIINRMNAYMKTDMNSNAGSDQIDSEWEGSELNRTGKTQTIAGYSCEVWTVENNSNEQFTLCMAKGMGSFLTPGNPMNNQNAPAWAKMIAREGYMPLEVIKTADGKEEVQMRATKIEEKSLDDSLFEIPEGYNDMTSMMKQMQDQQ